MLDQSFSYENFRILIEVENKRGNYLLDKNRFSDSDDIFSSVRSITDKIIDINKKISDEFKNLPPVYNRKKEDYKNIDDLENEKKELKNQREIELEKILREISSKINDENFKIEIEKGIVKYGAQLYVTKNSIENYLVLKQLQRNIFKTFGVKQSDRKIIISQIKLLLEDKSPKYVLRTDISKFYESIPHKQLINKIEENSLLNYQSKTTIKRILNQYWNILIAEGIKTSTDERIGLPRGVGISAILSELYLKDFDKKVRNLSNVIYYARYVDDIIIMFTPNHRKDLTIAKNFKRDVKSLIADFHLEMNLDKTDIYDLNRSMKDRKTTKNNEITFLGYKFCKNYKKNGDKINCEKLKVLMSDAKRERLLKKIEAAFDHYNVEFKKYSGKERTVARRLIQRIKILTANFRLYRRKSDVMVGIYFSNEFLTPDLDDLKKLDDYLQSQIASNAALLSSKTKMVLEKMSFVKGFEGKKTITFNFNERLSRGVLNIDEVIKIWSNI